MKKVLPMSLVALVSVSLLAPMAVQAATSVEAKTEADVSFTAGDDKPGEVGTSKTLVKPGTLDPITPTKGVNSEGQLRFEFAPYITFETTEISTGAKTIKSNMLTFQPKKRTSAEGVKPEVWETDTTAKAAYIPIFAQISDVRGEGGQFKLSLKQTAQFKAVANNQEELTGAQIRLGDKPEIFNTSSNEIIETPVTAGTVLEPGTDQILLQTDTQKSSISTTSSIVFKAGYTPDDYSNKDGKTPVTLDENSKIVPKPDKGIYLHIPGTTSVKKDTYKSELVWTLSDTI